MEFIISGIRAALGMILSGDPEVLGAAWRSLWISSLAVLGSGLLGIPLGVGLARVRFPGRRMLIEIFRAAMAFPTVFVGLVCFSLFARSGPLGSWNLLYTPWAIVLGELMLAIPMTVALTQAAVSALDPRVGETALTLGCSPCRRFLIYLSEAHLGIKVALLTAFSRCVTELGIAMMVGGNLKGQTRTLSTATALETSKGEFEKGVAMGLILLAIALGMTLISSRLSGEEQR